jgi:hypothetical protein
LPLKKDPDSAGLNLLFQPKVPVPVESNKRVQSAGSGLNVISSST